MPVFAVIFLVMSALVFLAVSLGLKYWESERKKRVAKILHMTAGPGAPPPETLIRNDDQDSPITVLLSRWDFSRRLDAWIRQAGLEWSAAQLLLVTAMLAGVGAVFGAATRLVFVWWWSAAAFALVLGSLPWLYLQRKRRQRLAQFEKQFPEALDFISRAMRAGHAFTATLEMLANESPPPIGPEFRKLYDEQNLGAPLEVAMRKLVLRVPMVDVRFFVSAVLLQKYTGGNLGEILRNLARVIRERFQLKGHVRAASAHGRITATVLTILPIATMCGLMFLAPDYLRYMATDEHGKYLVIGAVVLLIIGYYFMRRIINIKI